jgi:spoIIIJ-associated protein
MRSIEAEGDSIDEAIDKALQLLHVARERVAIEILSGATRGLFGFGAKKARIRATVRAPLSTSIEAGGLVSQGTAVSGTLTSAGAAASGARSLEDVGRHGKSVLEEILRHLGVAGRVDLEVTGNPAGIVLHVTGDAGGLVIGRRGQTLDAIEYLVNRIAARGHDGLGRIMIDVEHYRERRKDHLEQLAHRLAEKVRQTGRPVTLNPLSPRDRRIVHLALQADANVTTRSQGEGVFRRIMIVPSRGHAPSARSTPT